MKRRVAGALIVRNGAILLGLRAANRTYPNCWDVPGGHVEFGETVSSALCRELRKELGIEATRFEFHSLHEGERHELHLFLLSEWQGTPSLRNEEHTALVWHDLATAHRLPQLADPRMADLLLGLARQITD